MTFKEKISKEFIDKNVAIDLVGGSSAKGKLVAVDQDFAVIKTSGIGEVYVAIAHITKIWETL
jgi:small nuclear ribonucleoprotein (snRNP)-like protein